MSVPLRDAKTHTPGNAAASLNAGRATTWQRVSQVTPSSLLLTLRE